MLRPCPFARLHQRAVKPFAAPAPARTTPTPRHYMRAQAQRTCPSTQLPCFTSLRQSQCLRQQQHRSSCSRRRTGRVVASAAGAGSDAAPSPTPPQPRAPPPTTQPKQGFFSSLYKSLRDFGIGKTSIGEGSVGLFLAMGGAIAVALILWVRGAALRKGQPYSATIEFPSACGITIGTPVRVRGRTGGRRAQRASQPGPVDVLVEVNDASTAIPRNSIIEANQSGLIAEPLVDITPQLPVPSFTASPLDKAACEAEGAIVCHNGHIRGQQGVSLDDLVYIMTKLTKQMDQEGVDKIFAATEAATAAIEEAKPLLQQATLLVQEVTPLLQVRNLGILKGVAVAAALP